MIAVPCLPTQTMGAFQTCFHWCNGFILNISADSTSQMVLLLNVGTKSKLSCALPGTGWEALFWSGRWCGCVWVLCMYISACDCTLFYVHDLTSCMHASVCMWFPRMTFLNSPSEDVGGPCFSFRPLKSPHTGFPQFGLEGLLNWLIDRADE